VITDRFVPSAKVLAQVNGVPDYAFAVIDHPVASDPDEALRGKAQIAVRQIVDMLSARKD
jgi:hypothetical protein